MNLLSCTYKVTGTNTFRLASTQILGTWGANCQNPDKRLMHEVVPRPGNCFLQCDQAGAEALIMANIAQRGRMYELFKHNIKPHTYLALHIFIEKFVKPEDKHKYWMASPADLIKLPEWKELHKLVKQAKMEYALGKMTCHAKNYDMKWMTFIINVLEKTSGEIILTAAQGKDFLNMFDLLFTEIIQLQEAIKAEVRATGMLRNLFGHPKRFVQPHRSTYERAWLAYIAQSTVGVLAIKAAHDIKVELKQQKLDREILLVNNKHDSLMLDLPERHVEYGADLLKRKMARDLRAPNGNEFRMGVEVSKGYNWKDMEEL